MANSEQGCKSSNKVETQLTARLFLKVFQAKITLELFTEDSNPRFSKFGPQQDLEHNLMRSSRLLLSYRLRFRTPASVFPNRGAFQLLTQTSCVYDPSAFPQLRATIQPLDNLQLLRNHSELSPNLVFKTSCSLEPGLPCRNGLGDSLDIYEEACCYPTHLNTKKKEPSPVPLPHLAAGPMAQLFSHRLYTKNTSM